MKLKSQTHSVNAYCRGSIGLSMCLEARDRARQCKRDGRKMGHKHQRRMMAIFRFGLWRDMDRKVRNAGLLSK